MGFLARLFRRGKKRLTPDQLARLQSSTLWVVPGESLVSGATGKRGKGFLVYGRSKDLKRGQEEPEIPKKRKILIVRPDHERFLHSTLASRVVYRAVVSSKTISPSGFGTTLMRGYDKACRAMEEIEKAGRLDGLAILICDDARLLLEFLHDLKSTTEDESEAGKVA
jgi:hypothetical protein